MPSSLKKRNKLYFIIVGWLAIGLLLSGCNLFASPDQPASPPPVEESPQPADEAAPGRQSIQPTEEPVPTAAPTETPTPLTSVAEFPDPGSFAANLLIKGLDRPLFLTHAGDGSGRLFVIEKPGRIIILQDGERLDAPFLDIVGLVGSRQSERGLLGLAFHPDYAQNGYFYLNYTDQRGDTVVARYQVSADPNIADPDSQKILLTVSQPYANHNGGMIAFGPDGYLYIGMGDGGSGGDPQGNAQNPGTLLGKMLRIDVDSGDPYGIPEGNSPGDAAEIWASGVRNPWRFSFDRATGDLWIGDVGQKRWEEISLLPAGLQGGANLGWDYFEGTHSFEGAPPEGAVLVEPVIEYNHTGGNCSVTGGYVYRGSHPDWQGVYLYGDYCSGTIWGAFADPDGVWQTDRLFTSGQGTGLASFGEDENGELYAVYLNGVILKLISE